MEFHLDLWTIAETNLIQFTGWVTLLIVLGAAFGSFIAAITYRVIYQGNTYLARSKCIRCGHHLNIFDLIPIFSWCLVLGRCRYCRKPISPRYMIIESASIVFTLLIAFLYGVNILSLWLILVTYILIAIFVTDLEHLVIPDVFLSSLLCIGTIYSLHFGRDIVGTILVSIVCTILGFSLRYGGYFWKKRDAFGMADIKFLSILGFYLNLFQLPTFFLFAGIGGILTALIGYRRWAGKVFPFGPALATSLWLHLVCPNWIQNHCSLAFDRFWSFLL
jgi:leader peptidase (prepilin peptidase)/N-methyltransferase